jgi:hypothetical protein
MSRKMQTNDYPMEEELVSEEETLEGALPFDEYGKDQETLRAQIDRLEKEYDEREKVIWRIMEYGTGIETEKALRMYPRPVLEKWEESLETYRASRLKK